MTMISFTHPFGFVANGRDEKGILRSWRQGLDFFGFVGRFRFFRDVILPNPIIGPYFLPKVSHQSGTGWLMREADKQVTERERQMEQESGFNGKKDFMQ